MHLTSEQATQLIHLLGAKGLRFDAALSDEEVLQAETAFGITFPPDLGLLLQTALPISEKFPNWRLALHSKEAANKIISMLEWPLEGILFDVRTNNFWHESWGDRPATCEECVAVVKQHYQAYPRLAPIYSHRYIPTRPHQGGNPVFSVYQTDVIYYGRDLPGYLANEFGITLPHSFEKPARPGVQIEFWSGLAERL
jgi:hypothetical protein